MGKCHRRLKKPTPPVKCNRLHSLLCLVFLGSTLPKDPLSDQQPTFNRTFSSVHSPLSTPIIVGSVVMAGITCCQRRRDRLGESGYGGSEVGRVADQESTSRKRFLGSHLWGRLQGLLRGFSCKKSIFREEVGSCEEGAYLDFASLQVRDYKSPKKMGEQENVCQKEATQHQVRYKECANVGVYIK